MLNSGVTYSSSVERNTWPVIQLILYKSFIHDFLVTKTKEDDMILM